MLFALVVRVDVVIIIIIIVIVFALLLFCCYCSWPCGCRLFVVVVSYVGVSLFVYLSV